MARNKEVVAKRGCTCCGTGCVLMGLVAPLATLALWEAVGWMVALAVWALLFGGAHLARHVTGHPKRIIS